MSEVEVIRHDNGRATVIIYDGNMEVSLSLTKNELDEWQKAFSHAKP